MHTLAKPASAGRRGWAPVVGLLAATGAMAHVLPGLVLAASGRGLLTEFGAAAVLWFSGVGAPLLADALPVVGSMLVDGRQGSSGRTKKRA